ncbi:MAG: PAS domain S-box protein, partial [Chloroflexales bacterium]|nr:PAS domain S-box protein [Chloroflexales bacterium]
MNRSLPRPPVSSALTPMPIRGRREQRLVRLPQLLLAVIAGLVVACLPRALEPGLLNVLGLVLLTYGCLHCARLVLATRLRHRPANLRAWASAPAAREAPRSRPDPTSAHTPLDFRALADHALVGIFVTTLEGEWRYANAALAQLLEYASPAALMQQNVRELYQQPAAREALLTRLRRGEPVRNAELELRAPSGALRTVLASVTLAGDQLTGMLIDITERTRAEQQAHVTLETYRVLFETLPVGVTITDQEGQIRETNPAAVAILQLPMAEHTQRALTSPVWQIIRPDGSPMPVEEFAGVRALREQRRVSDVEMGVISGAGQVSWISVTAAPLPIPGQGAVIVYQDISAHKQAARI